MISLLKYGRSAKNMSGLHRTFYYLDERGQELGPFEKSVLKSLYVKGFIKEQSLVWSEGYESWIPYSDAFPNRNESEHLLSIFTKLPQSLQNWTVLLVLGLCLLSILCCSMLFFLNDDDESLAWNISDSEISEISPANISAPSASSITGPAGKVGKDSVLATTKVSNAPIHNGGNHSRANDNSMLASTSDSCSSIIDNPQDGKPTIISAVLDGNIAQAKALIRQGNDINQTDKKGNTAIMLASEIGMTSMVSLLVDAQADTDIENVNAESAFSLAVKNKHFDCLNLLLSANGKKSNKTLLKYICTLCAEGNSTILKHILSGHTVDIGAKYKHKTPLEYCLDFEVKHLDDDKEPWACINLLLRSKVNVKNQAGTDALCRACVRGKIDTVRMLLKSGVDPNIRSKGKENDVFVPILMAATCPSYECVDALIKSGADVNVGDDGGSTALHCAAMSKNTKKLISRLIEAGAKVNAKDSEGLTPLYCASQFSDDGAVKALLEAGANPNIGDKEHGSILLYAVLAKRDSEIIKLLIEHGSDVNFKDKKGVTALMIAAGNGDAKVMRLLIKNGADISAHANNGVDALLAAIEKGHLNCVEILIKAGVDLNRPRYFSYGSPPIVEACKWDNADIVRLLIKSGAKVNIPAQKSDLKGYTALMFAAGTGHVENTKILLNAGANFRTKAKDGMTALKLAIAEEQEECAEILMRLESQRRIIDRQPRVYNGSLPAPSRRRF